MEAEAEQNFLVIKEKVLARNYNESMSKDFIMQNILTPYQDAGLDPKSKREMLEKVSRARQASAKQRRDQQSQAEYKRGILTLNKHDLIKLVRK